MTEMSKKIRSKMFRLRTGEEESNPMINAAFDQFLKAGKIENNGTTTTFKYTIKVDEKAPRPEGLYAIINLHGMREDALPQNGERSSAVGDNVLSFMLSYLSTPKNTLFISPKSLDSINPWNSFADLENLVRLISKLFFYGDVDPTRCYMIGFDKGGSGVARMAPALSFLLAGAVIIHPKDHEIVLSAHKLHLLVVSLDPKDISEECNIVKHYAIQKAEIAKTFGHKFTFPLEIIGKPFFNTQTDKNEVRRVMKNNEHSLMSIFEKLFTYTRVFLPQNIVWKIDKLFNRDFYWLALPDSENPINALILAFHSGQNEFSIQAVGVEQIYVLFNSDMIDFKKKVVIYWDETIVFENMIVKDVSDTIENRYLSRYHDRNYKFTARQLIKKPKV